MKEKIYRKHVLVVGKSSADRSKFADGIIAASNKVLYRFPKEIRSFDEYIEQVRTLFPFVPKAWHEQNPKKWTRNQVWDFHLDWTDNTHSILIIIEEFGGMEESWKTEIIRDYLTKSYDQEQPNRAGLNFQLIVTQEQEDGLVERLSESIGLNEDEKRTGMQVVLGKLQVVDLSIT
jgi:hypothetical protein